MAEVPSRSLASSEVDPTTQYRATKLFLKIVQAYHVRQYIFAHLTATEAARLVHATKIGNLIGRQERSRVLNPMRNLFTDDELDAIDSQLASNPDHHVIVIGRDLEDLYARVENAGKLDSGIPLLLSIVETTIRGDSTLSTPGVGHLTGSEKELRAYPTTNLPGKWLMGSQESKVGMFSMSRSYSEVSEEKGDIRDKRIRLRRRRLAFEYTRRHVNDNWLFGRNVLEHLTNKGMMTMLKGNVQQTLGKANQLTTRAGADHYGLAATVLDDMVYVDMRDPVLKRAINSGRTRKESMSMRRLKGAYIEISLQHDKDCWYIPLGRVDLLSTEIS
jgi:hypothetical protein